MPWKVRLLLIGAVAVGVGLLAFAGIKGSTAPCNRPDEITQLLPGCNDQVLQQAEVGLVLSAGYDAALAVNGTNIPDDELTKVKAINKVTFTPGPGKTLEKLAPQQNCVTATYFKFEDGPTISSTYTWCFRAA
jgi:hypothetical protein